MAIFNNMFAPLNLSHNHNTRAAINYLLGQRPLILRIFCIQENHISKIFYPANISCFPRRLQGVFQDVFSVTLLVFQGVLKTSSKRFQDVFAISLRKTSSRRLQDIFKTSWKTKKCYTEDVFSTSSPRRMFAGLASMKMITELIVFYFLKLQFMVVIKMINFVFFYQYSISFIYSVYCISLSITICSFIYIIFSFISVFFFFLFVSFFA